MDRILCPEEQRSRSGPDQAAGLSRIAAAGCRTQQSQSRAVAWRPLRFIQQFGPGRPWNGINSSTMVPQLLFILLYISTVFRIAESCSSRSTPKPRPTSATMRPNITFQTYACPEAYAKWYCLNGATCFAVKIRDSILYNCECADGYMGQRCEFKDLDGSYLRNQQRESHDRKGEHRWWSHNSSLTRSTYLAHLLHSHEAALAAEVHRLLSGGGGGGGDGEESAPPSSTTTISPHVPDS
ncbi:uncharacterized protein LOC129225530 isoform X2 [Uloborus diversus]|uniref:uncharacterized protein LOC129225530 isoform X2 n=1 Tax=Uloborus diversus TaxID=327109 RepID=UPI00240A9954|nr:uncharacterized protein LOC129225530 isoform X2 [Uloborus diversus]